MTRTRCAAALLLLLSGTASVARAQNADQPAGGMPAPTEAAPPSAMPAPTEATPPAPSGAGPVVPAGELAEEPRCGAPPICRVGSVSACAG